jgi:hypothetical protein
VGALQRFGLWLARDAAPAPVCAERMEWLFAQPALPHPAGAHVCCERPGHLALGRAHQCRNCSVTWWPSR